MEENTATTDVKIEPKQIMICIGVFVALLVDGMDIQLLSLSLLLIMKDFHLSTVQAGALGTYTLMGMAIGGVVSSWLSDQFGRVRLVIFSLCLFSITTCVLGFVQTFEQFAILRFISGLGLAAVWMCSMMVVAEYIPTQMRATVVGIIMSGWALGYIVAALASVWVLPLYGWRPMFVGSILPSIIAFVLLLRAEDSPSWKASRDARLSGQVKHQSEWLLIWKDTRIRKNFFLWTVVTAMLQVGYFGANNWLPSYLVRELGVNLKNMGWYVTATYTMALIGKFVFGYIADRFGRRFTWTLAGVTTALGLPLLMKFGTAENIPYLLLVLGFIYGAPYAFVGAYISESFPTFIRGTAFGLSYNLGRIVAIGTPVMIGYVASQYSIAGGLALLGLAYFVCGIIPGLFIPNNQYDPEGVKSNTQEQRNVLER